ncbi:hypothetical protein [Paenibacillus bouchesdurhonensis]|uniref:hypothetical protein n=1 Tax=Paenibacillus bouchesdurhonensis TaxID=1870990 RepID=UPI000DA60CDE|nr:hypothetical protein [Paenibacillus bouchesdurhonensis]
MRSGDRMKGQRMLLFIFLSILVLLVGGCKGKEELKREEEIRAKAEQVALTYFKEKYNVNVVFTEYSIRPSYINTTIWFDGYIEGKLDEKLNIIIDYVTYDVNNAGIPKKYMNNQKFKSRISSNMAELLSD